jgi:aldose 1-epimerase
MKRPSSIYLFSLFAKPGAIGIMGITNELFGTTADGEPIDLYTLAQPSGLEARIMTYGGTLVSLRMPGSEGPANVVLGFDALAPYLAGHPFFGALVGRFGNRIANGRFQLHGVEYVLARNDGDNHLHGGPRGFDKVVWRATPREDAGAPTLDLTYLSRDGEEGYPGNLEVTVAYTLTDDSGLRIDYQAKTDRDTVVNLTNHSYFNLAGAGDILAHEMRIPAQRFLPTDASLIPTGERRPVDGTPMDFTHPTAIGARIHADDEQLQLASGGYDHTWVLDKDDGELSLAAEVYDPSSGRVLEVFTTQPGIQFYTGNFLDGSLVGARGQAYQKHFGFCLETQHFPDSPNQPNFPSTVLRPGDVYQQTTIFRLSTR